MDREEILREAIKCVCEDRNNQYNEPENNFKIISDFWSTYLGFSISDIDVAVMMALLKIARIKTGAMKDDSFVDACGYMACGGELASSFREEYDTSMKKLNDFLNKEGNEK